MNQLQIQIQLSYGKQKQKEYNTVAQVELHIQYSTVHYTSAK